MAHVSLVSLEYSPGLLNIAHVDELTLYACVQAVLAADIRACGG